MAARFRFSLVSALALLLLPGATVGQVILALVLAAISGVVAAIWPARKASRMNILDAITSE